MSTLRKLAALAMLSVASMAQAQLAQEPLLNRVSRVPPNLTFLMDDSISMRDPTIYEHGKPDGLGPRGPGSGIYGPNSPDVNKIYYDPRVRYQPRPDYSGAPLTLGPLVDTWSVYFRKTTGPYTEGQLTTAADYHDPYVPPAHLVVSGSTASYPVRVTAGTPAFTPFPKFIDRTDCRSATACTLAEEQRNYTIWKQWYSNRLEMSKTGIALAFQPVKKDSIRLGFATITDLGKHERLARGVAPFSDAPDDTKQRFFAWLYAINTKSGTPNIRALINAGKYHERSDSDGPWGTTPNPDSAEVKFAGSPRSIEPTDKHASCRRSFSMLVTDGYWSDRPEERTGASKRADESWSIELENNAKYEYQPRKPYRRAKAGSSANTLSDVAMHFWGRDLRPDLRNRVPELATPAGKNESKWQNVSFYAVTLGLLGSLQRDAATWAKLNEPKDPLHFPEPEAGKPTTIDDTWHATVNGRGELLNANNSSELTRAVKRMLQGITGTPQTLSGVAVSSAVGQAGLRKYKPEYLSGSWSGNLSAIELDPATGKDMKVVWTVENGADSNGDPRSTIPAAALRNVVTWSGSASVPFTAGNVKSLSPDLVSYLRGDTSKELRKPGGTYRNRDTLLGPVVNSTPLFVRDALDMNYEALPDLDAAKSYRAFVTAKTKRPGALFVGASDGMLHGFSDNDGVETFAYVPKAVWPKLPALAETPYEHSYYVDGPNVEADAYLAGKWTNLLVGTTGAGAKAVYAINVTAPLAPKLMWEINSDTPQFKQMGHVLSGVHTGVLQTGEWVAIFGNGVGSTGGTARLYVVDLATGTLMHDMPVGAGVDNGLGPVTVVHDDKRRIIGAYAGDLHGTLWKFDLTRDFKGGSALYQPESATPRHPITAAPAVLPHPDAGRVVTFGTGRFFNETDITPPYKRERLYGIWDAKPFGSAAEPVKGVTQLTPQTVTEVDVPPRKFYRISTAVITWGNGTTGVRGWFLDLPEPGQRLVYPIQRLHGSFVLATTISPRDEVRRDVCEESGAGTAWSYIIDGVTGSGVTRPTLDTNGDDVINMGDEILSGFQHDINGPPAHFARAPTRRLYKGSHVGSTGTLFQLDCKEPGIGGCPDRTRQWRQVFLRP